MCVLTRYGSKTEKKLIGRISLTDPKRYDEKLVGDGKRLPDPYFQVIEWNKNLVMC